MARISLLFSLAFALGLCSLFLSVSGHAPPTLKVHHLWPKTVYELETLPFAKITHLLNRKEKFAPKTAEFKAMFTMCKGYVVYLESLYKLENPIVDVLGIAKAKYILMDKAILAAQASVIGQVDNKTSKRKLRKSCSGLTKTFLQIQKTIISISAKHDFKANAKLSFRESAKISNVVVEFRMYLDVFMDIVYDIEEKKMKIVGHHARKLEDDRVKNAFARFFRTFADKYGGYMGGKNHGRKLNEANDQKFNSLSHGGADIKGFEVICENFSKYFGGYFGAKSRRELAGVNAGVQFNAAGKIKFVGKDGFRSLNRAHNKHMI
ncbi:unnamed protein product [Arabis nemorensis]|uniref:Pectinesterase inhibitor domain-containing protein n=1 Tax=Arabis nemorensis TaxID=586526 RepID=A0A565C6I7_9BRAS|nr:unnamed protein product [Arabis nemorensis]